jgi:hypothetical protein
LARSERAGIAGEEAKLTKLSPDAPDTVATRHEFIDAEIAVSGLETPADDQALGSALSGLDDLQRLSIAGGKIVVEYDPVRITKAEPGRRDSALRIPRW